MPHHNAVPPDLSSAAEAALRNPDDETAQLAVVDRWRDVHAAKVEDYIREAVAGWPPLTDKQKSEIATLLRSSQPLDAA
jgi:hypothetical protein